ncbi:MAG: PLP-dependent aminotransferase family protein [Bacillota bacterium]
MTKEKTNMSEENAGCWEEITVDRSENRTLYQQLYSQIKTCIETGRLEENSQLPAIRELADRVGVNPATVVKAYELLAEEEYIYKKVGSGSFVAPRQTAGPARQERLTAEEEEKSLEMLGYGQIELNNDINFASATPSSSLFPVEDFKTAINQVLDRDRGEAFTYQKSQGYYPLRQSIAHYFASQGLKVPLEEIQIVSGAQQAIDLLVKIFLDYGEQVLVESPTYPGAISAFQSRAAQIEAIPMEPDGIDTTALESALASGDFRLLYVMTGFHNPTGVCWSKEKKLKVLELAQEYDLLIIEDDCISELAYRGESPLPLKAFDETGRVIYIKSFSKIFMPGLRLAFLTLPEQYRSRLLAAKHATDISSAGLTQRAMDYYFRAGMWENHISKIKKLFRQRFETMLAELESTLIPPVQLVYKPEGGIYFWLQLPLGVAADRFYLAAREKRVALLPGDIFLMNQRERRAKNSFFRLSFAAVTPEEIKTGISRLADIFTELDQDVPQDSGYSPLV